MASSWTQLGDVTDSNDEKVTVSRDRVGWVRLTGQHDALEFTPDEFDKLRELLDRAAAPGQVPPATEAAPEVTPLDTALQHVREARQFLGERNRYRKALEQIARKEITLTSQHATRDIAREALKGEPPATEAHGG